MVETIVQAVFMAWVTTGFGLWGLVFIFGGFEGEFEDTPVTSGLITLALCGLLWPTVLYRLIADEMDNVH